MKFTTKAISRIQSELDLDARDFGKIQSAPEKIPEVMRIAFECAGKSPDEAKECVENATQADLIEAWSRDFGLDILKKFESPAST